MENLGIVEPLHPGIMFCIDGVESDAYKLQLGAEPALTIKCDDGECHAAFIERVQSTLTATALRQKSGDPIPIVMPAAPTATAGSHESTATGAAYTITIGGHE